MNHLVTADVAQIRIAEIDGAAAVIRRGGLVGIPTETVYGLAADATNPGAVAGIYHAKGRPRFNPLIIHVSDFQTAREHGVFDGRATTLAERFWPGPLTLVVPAQQGSPVSDLARAGLASVALRAPAHPIAAALLRAVGLPLAAPSANRSGRVSATTAAHVSDELGAAVDLVLDGGPARIGLESTIIGLLDNTPRILRAGGLPRELIEEALGVSLAAPAHGETLAAPGMLASHYAPHAPLRINVVEAAPGEAILAFGQQSRILPDDALNLSPRGDLTEAAANLFGFLRQLDALRPLAIAVQPVPDHGLGEAINDRLRRAAVR